MPHIDRATIDSILDRVRIEDVVGEFVDLTKKGARYLGLCPFHDDHNPTNFSVYPKKKCYRCFACGERGGAVDFLMKHAHLSYPDAIRWLGKRYNILVDDQPLDYTPPPPKPPPPAMPTLTLPIAMVLNRQDLSNDNLAKWIAMIKWDSAQQARVQTVLQQYHVGHSERTNMTIFWQIDEDGNVRTGKMMRYKTDGHRDKESKYNFDFIHSSLFRAKVYDENRYEVKLCLFGLHLLNSYPNATVNLVESEKTAILMAIAYGNHEQAIWMATGGMQNLSREKLLPLINARRQIVCYPDRDGVETWRQKMDTIGYDFITLDTDPVTKWWRPEDGEKADIADIIINRINSTTFQ